jgi:hypothetical protein
MESQTLLQMDRLIRLLKQVDEFPSRYMVSDEATRTGLTNKRYYDESHPVIRDIIGYATEYLTTGPDVHFCRNMLREAGYPVYPGEVDRFGWLTAYFQMKEGIILFG